MTADDDYSCPMCWKPVRISARGRIRPHFTSAGALCDPDVYGLTVDDAIVGHRTPAAPTATEAAEASAPAPLRLVQ